jgi:endonuclease/exonuclease/phosphatase family metal-dependent hydrolase
MRLLFWNIGYAPGLNGSLKDYVLSGHRLVSLSEERQKEVLNAISDTIVTEKPDIALYAEISIGSRRNRQFNQHEYLLNTFDGVVEHAAHTKYRSKIIERMPMHRGNANGFISWVPCDLEELHLSVGRKTLVYFIKTEWATILMVHLSLKEKIRRVQFQELAIMVNAITGPVVVCGDMNIFGGVGELDQFLKSTGLSLPQNIPATYPAFNPKLSLDLCLFKGFTTVSVTSLASEASDHAPLLIETTGTKK